MPSPEGATRDPFVSVVVPTRNRARRLASLLAALEAQTVGCERFEVIVIDDGSSDDTPAVLDAAARRNELRLRCERGSEAGPAAARNIGWRLARAPLVAFTDDDCEPGRRWLEAGVAAAAAAPQAIIQGRTRPIPREATELGPLARTKVIDGPGPWFQTCNIFYPRQLLERVDGFDERFRRPFGEDADLAWRAMAAGAPARFVPKALVHHAVERLSPREFVRSALRDPDEALIFKRHRPLRRTVRRLGLFKSDQHALILLAAIGLLVARRRPTVASLAVPYAALVALRARGGRPAAAAAPLLVAHDAIELFQAIRGALRHRSPLI